jgi:hypothetical protein
LTKGEPARDHTRRGLLPGRRAPGHPTVSSDLAAQAISHTAQDAPAPPKAGGRTSRELLATLHSFARLTGRRQAATLHKKREVNYLAMVTIGAIVLLWPE